MPRTILSFLHIVIACSLVYSPGCGKSNPAGPKPDEPALPENHAPDAVGAIPSQNLTTGKTPVELDVSRYFRDVDGDQLRYTAASSNDAIATAGTSGAILTIRPISPGSATVTVTATDSHGLSATQTVRVHVEEDQPPEPPETSEPPEPPEPPDPPEPPQPPDPPEPPDPPDPPLTGPYTPLEWIRVSAGRIEIHGFSLGFIRCIPLDATVNGIRYLVHESHWQWRENASSPLAEVDGTRKTGEICSYTPKRSGAFRLVMVMSIDGIRGRYASWNTINALCMPNSEECSYTYPDNPSQSQVAGRRPGH